MVLDDLDYFYARTLFFLLSDFCDQILFCGPCPIFSPENQLYIHASAHQFPNGFHHYLPFLTPFRIIQKADLSMFGYRQKCFLPF
jgi:hypothetical protein